MKWYHKILIAIGVIAFSPLILFGILIACILYIFQLPKEIKEYKNSHYYKDFQLPFKSHRLHSPEYRFYNSAEKRNLQVDYIKQQSNGLEYFIYEDTIFLFPDFDQIDFNEEKSIWEADYDGTWEDFEEIYKKLLSKIENKEHSSVKLLVERKMFPMTDLNEVNIPECIFLTWNYETSFENEDSPLKLIIPVNAKELYDMMCNTPDLCGSFEITGNGSIRWSLYDDIQIDIGVDPRDCYIGISKKLFGKIDSSITHWHPTIYDIYEDVYEIGKRGNILVIKKLAGSEAVLYMGNKENCPLSVERQKGKSNVYYLEAK